MRRPSAFLFLLLVTALAPALALGPAAPASGEPASQGGRPRQVVVISIPRLGWEDVSPTTMPNLVGLADRGGLASLSVKTFGLHTDRGAGYATLGAGSRTKVPSGAAARAHPRQAGGHGIVVPGLEGIASANSGTREGAEPGAFGSAVHRAGWTTAVVANHDGPGGRDRSATLGVVDALGTIDAGSVGARLTRGVGASVPQTNGDQVVRTLGTLDDAGSVVLVEIGDIDWADEAGGARRRASAVTRSDVLLGRVLDALDLTSALVVVLSPVAPHGPRDQPTPFVVAGAGTPRGWARSASTRLDGHVTLTDVAPMILDRIGAEVPASMNGTTIEVRRPSPGDGGRSGAARAAAARSATAEVRFIDGATGRLLTTIPIVFACWSSLALAVTLVPPGGLGRLLRAFVRWVALVQIALPGVTFAGAAWSVRSWGQPAWAVAMWGSACLLAGAASFLRRPGRAPIVLASATWVLLVGDLATAGRLQFASALGNSPTVAGRFAGIGNLAFGLLAATSILVAVAVHRAVLGRTSSERGALAAAAVVLGVAVIVDGAPSLGADVGGVLALAPASIATLALLAPRRPSIVRVLALGAAGTASLLAALAVLDRLRPSGEESHLARFTDRIGDGRAGEVLWRKADAALASVTGSSLVWITVCTLIALALLWTFARAALLAHLANRWARAAWLGGATASFLGAAFNDSGVMVSGMILVVLVPTAGHVLLRPGGPLDRSVSS